MSLFQPTPRWRLPADQAWFRGRGRRVCAHPVSSQDGALSLHRLMSPGSLWYHTCWHAARLPPVPSGETNPLGSSHHVEHIDAASCPSVEAPPRGTASESPRHSSVSLPLTAQRSLRLLVGLPRRRKRPGNILLSLGRRKDLQLTRFNTVSGTARLRRWMGKT